MTTEYTPHECRCEVCGTSLVSPERIAQVQSDARADETARADKAESLLTNAEGAIDCPRCKTRAIVNNPCPECGHTTWNPPLLLQGIRATQEAAETLARQASEQKERADKAEAACAKMRYFIERYKGKLCQCNPIDGKCNLCFVSEHALSTDCGKGWISPEQAASLKCQWQMDCEQKARDICSRLGWLPPDKVKVVREALEYVYRWWDETGRDEGWHRSIGRKVEQALAAVKE